MRVTLKLYATLTDYLPAAARRENQVVLDADGTSTIAALLAPFQIPPRLTHLVLVNGVYVPPEERGSRTFRDGDVLAIWPPIAGG